MLCRAQNVCCCAVAASRCYIGFRLSKTDSKFCFHGCSGASGRLPAPVTTNARFKTRRIRFFYAKIKTVEQQFNKNNRPYNTKAIFSHPFCPEFWRCAAGEFKNWRMLVFAAVIIAMRIAVKAVKIVIIPGALNFGFDFIVNSAGSMIYGPLVGLLVGTVSDTIGAVLFPTGAYFFPFIFVEMLSSFIFGLFLYRAKLSSWRVIARAICGRCCLQTSS